MEMDQEHTKKDYAGEVDIVAVLKLPVPVGAFLGTLKALQKHFRETLYVRHCSDGYEIFKYRTK